MSEPRHIYGAGEWIGERWSGIYDDERVVGDRRYTLTDGEEWSGLMSRARAELDEPAYKYALQKHDLLEDILRYLGERP